MKMIFAISLVVIGFIGVACFSAVLVLLSMVGGLLVSISMTIRGIYFATVRIKHLFKGKNKCNSFFA